MWSLAFGIIVLLRSFAAAYAGRISFGKAALYGLLLLACIWLNGLSLYTRSKWGFIAITILVLLPILGVLGHSVHLLRLASEGELTTDWSVTILSMVGLVQLIVTFTLFRHLLSKEVREHIWKETA
jgi:hypothetical protein